MLLHHREASGKLKTNLKFFLFYGGKYLKCLVHIVPGLNNCKFL